MSACGHDPYCPGYGAEHDAASKPVDLLASLRNAVKMVEETNGGYAPHQHLVSPTGTRCIGCGEKVTR